MTESTAIASVDVDTTAEHAWELVLERGPRDDLWHGVETVSDYEVGGPIRWSGVWQGVAFENHGTVLEVVAPHLLRTADDVGDGDLVVTTETVWTVLPLGADRCRVTVAQRGVSEAAVAAVEATWRSMLATLVAVVRADAADSVTRTPRTP